MSFKYRLQIQFHNLAHSLTTWQAPAWVDGLKLRVSLLLFLVAIFGAYITQTSTLMVTGYKINELENDVNNLNKEIQKIDISVLSYSSIQNVEDRVKNSGLVAVNKVNHLTPAAAVAMR